MQLWLCKNSVDNWELNQHNIPLYVMVLLYSHISSFYWYVTGNRGKWYFSSMILIKQTTSIDQRFCFFVISSCFFFLLPESCKTTLRCRIQESAVDCKSHREGIIRSNWIFEWESCQTNYCSSKTTFTRKGWNTSRRSPGCIGQLFIKLNSKTICKYFFSNLLIIVSCTNKDSD